MIHRTKPQRALNAEDRRVKAASLYLRGHSQKEIATELSVSRACVSRDIKAIRQEWREDRVATIEEQRIIENAKIDQIEREAWQQWEKSKQAEVVERVESDVETAGRRSKAKAVAKREIKTTRGKTADARFMTVIQWCSEQRAKINGLYAPTKIAPTTPDGEKPYQPDMSEFSDDELELLVKIRNRSTEIATSAPSESEAN
jgi:predicted transcriptional regulator